MHIKKRKSGIETNREETNKYYQAETKPKIISCQSVFNLNRTYIITSVEISCCLADQQASDRA